MSRAQLFLLSLLLLLPACGTQEPINGCLLAAANQREIVRARNYLHAAIPARVLCIRSEDDTKGHAALIYRLLEGWCVYDDAFGSRRLFPASTSAFPEPRFAALVAFPTWPIGRCWYLDAPPAR